MTKKYPAEVFFGWVREGISFLKEIPSRHILSLNLVHGFENFVFLDADLQPQFSA